MEYAHEHKEESINDARREYLIKSRTRTAPHANNEVTETEMISPRLYLPRLHLHLIVHDNTKYCKYLDCTCSTPFINRLSDICFV